ncbi:MAG: YaaA family protein [Clostridiales bacterium]|nr:YaaA family protein [Clostridiales bacterium]
MKIIISPAKVQTEQHIFDYGFKSLIFENETCTLNSYLKDYSKNGISKLMKIKNKLLDNTYETIQNDFAKNHAINLYNGTVYKEINTNLYDELQLEYMNSHLRILSALYGVLEPLTGISPYRLDMTMKPNQINLYDFWKSSINKYFKDELIINLASLEYSKMIHLPMINIHFKELINDTYKIVTVRAKKARGLMVDYLITHVISDLEDLKSFSEAGYQFNETLSDEKNFVFTKEEEHYGLL